MTPIRQKKAMRRYIDHATPDDRLRHSAGMGWKPLPDEKE